MRDDGAQAADLVIRSRRAVLPAGEREAAVRVRGGKIAAVTGYGQPAPGDVDLGDLALLPGLVDTSVHAGAGLADVTRAAAAGGVTAICLMPPNAHALTASAPVSRATAAAALRRGWVDAGFWGAAVPGSLGGLRSVLGAGAVGLACSLAGEPGLPPLDAAGLRAAMAEIAPYGAPLAVHAEDPAELTGPGGPAAGDFAASRPPRAQRRAIETVIGAAAATGARAHIARLSAAECAALIAGASGAGIALTAETCPHHLFFTTDQASGDGTALKCCPPIRDGYNREALWRALRAGAITSVVSDHWPPPDGPPDGDFRTARAGIASLPAGLCAVWTAGRDRGLTLHDIATWMAAAPARLAGLTAKGAIAVGRDADLVAFDPGAARAGPAAGRGGRPPRTVYDGVPLTGRVERVWLRGTCVYGPGAAGEPAGAPLLATW